MLEQTGHAPARGDEGPSHSTSAVTPVRVSLALVLAIILVAANLRATLTGVGTLLPSIQMDTGISAAGGGLLNTLPLLTFAATSPWVGRLSHRFGASKVLVIALTLLIAGTVIRSLPAVPLLFIGTVVLSAAIACGNVLLPSLIRRDVPPRRIGAISALYVTVMAFMAAVSSGITVPLAESLGSWRLALAWGLVLAVVALVVWVPRVRNNAPIHGPTARSRGPWSSGLAWQVAVFMGLQSLGFYTAVAWLPSILTQQGLSEVQAGWMLSLYQVVALISAALVPLLTRGRRDQRWIAAGASLVTTCGFALLMTSASLVLVAIIALGLGGGVVLVLALGFQSQRAADHRQAASLAGMAQTVGYLIAAIGPLLLGAIHDVVGSWLPALIVLATASLVMAFVGFGAGRDRHVNSPNGSLAS